MWDWNGEGVEEEWLTEIIKKMIDCSQHTFQILSKRPKGYERFQFPHNIWLGTSITTTADCHRVHTLANLASPNIKFVSIEPIHEKIDFWFLKEAIDWIIVGAETGNRKEKIKPEGEWITAIIENARREGIPLFLKESLQWPETIQEYPGAVNTICNLVNEDPFKEPYFKEERRKSDER
jgi:protein gp37